VLRALAIVGALAFLALVMVQAMAFYAPPPEAPKARPHLLVVPPPPLVRPEQPTQPLDLFPATKAGILGPLRLSAPPSAPQRQDTRESAH
jgi:hypothetical protein